MEAENRTNDREGKNVLSIKIAPPFDTCMGGTSHRALANN